MTTQVTLRRLTLSDAPQLQVISETALGYPFSLEETEKQLERCLANDSHFLIGAVDESGTEVMISKKLTSSSHLRTVD
ncbi:hypothetical protein [Streptococcus sp. S784/96/1]|uniref:hypothetical protein n=1 Tax=Streptococcus sp. S784/96/1 TaxID=2653499 RepID=UPI001386CE69|nr:hypothetical protein [Streptococcus sp. S784/96/1]